MRIWNITLGILAIILFTGCSTTAKFHIPDGSSLKINGKEAVPDASGVVTRSPFGFSGANYVLDQNGKEIGSGALAVKFRIVSIFWPPFAFLYWPLGFKEPEYNLAASATGGEATAAPGHHGKPAEKKAKGKVKAKK